MSLHPPPATITFEAALRDLEARAPRARARAAHALGDVTAPADCERATAALLEHVRDPRREVRIEVAMSLGELAQEAAVPGLVDLLDDGDRAVRQGAAMALGKLGFRAGFDPLARQLKEGPPDLRFQAATSLVEIDPEAAYAPLAAALAGEDDPEVLGAIAVALGAIGDARAAGPLARLLDHGSRRTRFDAAYALAELGDERARPVLEEALSSSEDGWDAACALENLGDARAAGALSKLARPRKKPELIHVRAASALLALGAGGESAASAKRLLEAAATARKLEVAGLAIEEIGRLGGDWARKALERTRTSRRGRRFAEEIDRALAGLSESSR